MTAPLYRLQAPSRLHFGLLAWGDRAPRQFGSVGLMIEEPGLALRCSLAERDGADGPSAARVLAILERLSGSMITRPRLQIAIDRAPPEHAGLGMGTALSLAVARLALAASGEPEPSTDRLVTLTGRGLRSGIGLHGFLHGGLIVDGGRSASSSFPPLLARLRFPREWSILVVIPATGQGLAGQAERDAFSRLPGLSDRIIDRLCRLVLLGLLPAIAETDLPSFGAALARLQHEVGRGFRPAQGGLYSHPRVESLAAEIQGLGLVGVGQSSWGPALYGFLPADPDKERHILTSMKRQLGAGEVGFWTRASDAGAELDVAPDR